MKKSLFCILAKMNRMLIPGIAHLEPESLNGVQKLILIYRYWVTRNCL
jgi:hypothetical protein